MQPKESIRLAQVSRWRSAAQVDELCLKQAMQPKEIIQLAQVSRWRSAAQVDELCRYRPGSLGIGPVHSNQLTKPHRISLTSLIAQLKHSIRAIRFFFLKRGTSAKYSNRNANENKKIYIYIFIKGKGRLHMAWAPGPTKGNKYK